MNIVYSVGGWIFLLIGLAVSIGLHELGHLWPAKKFGVKVTKYMIGFGPTIFSRKRGETEYGLKLIPLGGYIQMIGMIPPADSPGKNRWKKLSASIRPADENDAADDARAFYKLKPWQKLIVMFGGPFANLLIAAVLTLVLFVGFGAYERSNSIQQVVACIPTDTNPACEQIGPDSPAKLAGLKAGDEILSFNGQAVTRWTEMDAAIKERIGKSTTIVVSRAGEDVALTITPVQITMNGQSRGYLGLFLKSERYQQSPIEALGNLGGMLIGTGQMIVQLPVQAVQAVGEIVPGSPRSTDGAISIIGLGQFSGEMASNAELSMQDKVLSQLGIILSLNVALFVFNMVPLVPLDGGHISGAIYEAIKRGIWRLRGKRLTKPVDTSQMMPIAYVVASLLMVLTLVLILRDILNPVHF